jgi:hypothetical protein
VRFYLDLKRQVDRHEKVSLVERALAMRAELAIDGTGDWTPMTGVDLDDLVNEMTGQLPRDDVDAFLGYVAFGFRSRALEAGLTGSLQVISLARDARWTVRLRIRVFTLPELEARLPTIGLDLTNILLRDIPDARVAAMIIWKERNRKPVLEGAVKERRTRMEVAQDAAASSVVFAFAIAAVIVLTLGVVVQGVSGFSFDFLGDRAYDWFKRLIGPFLTAVVASGSAVYLEYRKSRVPQAYWFVEGSVTRGRPSRLRRRAGRRSALTDDADAPSSDEAPPTETGTGETREDGARQETQEP